MAEEPPHNGNQPTSAPKTSHKPKKRVVWQAGRDSPDDGEPSETGAVLTQSRTPPGAPDAQELRRALTRVLSNELDEQQRQRDIPSISLHPAQSSGSPSSQPTPRLPRPALRRNTSHDDPEEREEADWAEQHATQRQLRSMTDARQRADRLAMSVGSYSAPGSRRNSSDLVTSFHPPGADAGDGTRDSEDDVAIEDRSDRSHILRHRAPRQHRPPDESQDQAAAENLVRSLTGRYRNRDLFQVDAPNSGTATPLPESAYSQDYVPRPAKYRGGILSSLLKLYNDDRGTSTSGSGYSTPIAPSTPRMSPQPSPPTSRPASVVGASRSRTNTGLFSSYRARQSTTSLTELVKSSSMFAAPGSSEISDRWAEKIKKEKEKAAKPKRERIRITVHIAGIMSRHRYLLKLCRALMMYGAPTHRLEEYMMMSSRILEIEGQFLYMPSCMLISFDDSATHTTEVKVVRVHQGIDLGRLRDVHNIYKDVVHDKVGVEEATKRLDEVMKRKPMFHLWIRVPMYGIASACVAPFAFEGRLIDLPIAFLLGCIVGLLQLVLAPSNELYANVFEVTAAIITSFLARGFGSIRHGELFCFSALAQSSIALILPGYMVLCSSLELQSHNIVAGSVRMVHAVIYTLFLGYGITIGASLYGMMDKHAASNIHCQAPLSRNWYFLFVPSFTLCLCIINQAKWIQMPVMTLIALAGFCVNSYSSTYFQGSNQISNMLGALTVGILANLYSRLGNHVIDFWCDKRGWWKSKGRPRFGQKWRRRTSGWSQASAADDPESRSGSPEEEPKRPTPKVGYSLAAAAMLPAILVQVPSGIAAGGSLLAGINTANALTGNSTTPGRSRGGVMDTLDGTAFNVLLSVIQVAIGISVGLFMSALIVYPLGKRRSGLFSF